MAKTLSEISRELKEFIIELQSDAHNVTGFKKYRYNNLKVEIIDPRLTPVPEVKVTIGMSEAVFNLNTIEKISGGLGPDERYVIRWFTRSTSVQDLKEAYNKAERQIGKAEGPEDVDVTQPSSD